MLQSNQKLINFFSRLSEVDINSETSINNDLECYGDDAEIMLLEFSEEFNVDISNLNFSKYFLKEEQLILYWFYKKFRPHKLNKIPITIEHLSIVVDKGYWIDPPSS